MDIILIPAYEPDGELISLTKQLREAGFGIVVVDDGSGPVYKEIFGAVNEFAHVVVHKRNKGKGAALKTGMAYIRDQLPDAKHFITCNGKFFGGKNERAIRGFLLDAEQAESAMQMDMFSLLSTPQNALIALHGQL